MPVYEHESRISAPLEEVWEFHSTAQGLRALTPGWFHLSFEEIRGPDGELDPDVLAEGSEIRLSVKPFGLLPRQSETSRITEREYEDGSAYFVDVMQEGPLSEWRHRHSFQADGDGTICADRVEYTLPFGRLGSLGRPGFTLALDRLFRYRHRRTRTLLESGTEA
jgi:ligand-binding SRPBCC domain-containing protein